MRFLAGSVFVLGAMALVLPLSLPPTPDAPPGVPPAVTFAGASGVHSASPRPERLTDEDLTQVVRRNCVVCHNDGLRTGNLSLQTFSVEGAVDQAQTAERVIRKVRAGMMPPPGLPRPGGDTLALLVETLESRIDAAAAAAPNLGARRFQRLSQAEYQRAVFDLLGLQVNPDQWLPPDILLGSFDNMAASQPLSTTLLESYLRAANEIARMALGRPDAQPATAQYSHPEQFSQHAWDRIEGAPFGTRGGIVVLHDFPADGEYVFEIETSLGTGNAQVLAEDVDFSIDGEPVALLRLPTNAGGLIPNLKTPPIFVRAGQRQVSAAFVNVVDGPYEDRFRPFEWSTVGAGGTMAGVTGLTHLDVLRITGPEKAAGVSDSESRRRVFSCRPARADEARACAASILERLATQAYRRTVSDRDVAQLMRFYEEGAASASPGADFEAGVGGGLVAILASPEFLFRLERQPAGVQDGALYPLNGFELATRLAFFLWSSSPDAELLAVAADGALSDPAVLERQVRRMLDDPRSEALATRFAHQWLRLQDVGKVWPGAYLYPDFARQTADAMVRETELLFDHLVREDRSLLDLFTADYTFLNGRLARHYGLQDQIPDAGDEFRQVFYPAGEQRRGVLGHGSVLLLTSMADRTSPVMRGKWVMEVLLGTPPPPPPPNVPVLEATGGATEGRRLTTRERMQVHRANPSCNSCHQFIDPIGLALDNFDVVGQWRIRENMAPLDTRGDFYDGTPIDTPIDLVNALMQRPTPMVRNFTERLLEYAIGRPAEYFDAPTVRGIERQAIAQDYRMSSFILGVVKSDAFRMRQAQTAQDR
jgi:hypothetical protein